MKLLILGSGMMGRGAAFDFCRQPDVTGVIIADRDLERARQVADQLGDKKVSPQAFDAGDENRIAQLMDGCSAAIGATSYEHNVLYSKVAIDKKVNFIDLGGSHSVVERQFAMGDLARNAGVALIPDCGLAPGLVNILSRQAADKLDEAKTIQIRVGGIPVNPKPPLNYFLVFSARGLINEYIEKCKVIQDGKVVEVDSMGGLESLHFQDPFGEMEAFYTSGGISTMTETMVDRVANMDYKTIRYPGHQHYVKFLIDLGFTSSDPVRAGAVNVAPRRVLEKLLQDNLSNGRDQDAIVLRITGVGTKNGLHTTYTQEIIDFADVEHGHTAMMRMTSFPAAIIALMLARGEITDRGALYQERSIPCVTFMNELRKRKITVSVRKQQE